MRGIEHVSNMSNAAESCSMWVGLAPNLNTKAASREQSLLSLNKSLEYAFGDFEKDMNITCGKGGPYKLKYCDLGGGNWYMGPQALSCLKYSINTIPTSFKFTRYSIEHVLWWCKYLPSLWQFSPSNHSISIYMGLPYIQALFVSFSKLTKGFCVVEMSCFEPSGGCAKCFANSYK